MTSEVRSQLSQLSQLTELRDDSSARPTRRRPTERKSQPIDLAPLWIGLAGTWGLAASIWPHSRAQQYSALAAIAAAVVTTWGIRTETQPNRVRIVGVLFSLVAITAIGFRVSGLTAVFVWGSGVVTALVAYGGGQSAAVRSWPHHPGRRAQPNTFVMALVEQWDWRHCSAGSIVAVGVAQATWWRTGSLAVFGAAIALALVLAALARGPLRWRALDNLVVRVISTVFAGVGLIFTALVAVPLMYVPALCHRTVRRFARGHAPAAWIHSPEIRATQLRDRSRMFVSPPDRGSRHDQSKAEIRLDRCSQCTE